jgi:PAS domain S-box-containing protein
MTAHDDSTQQSALEKSALEKSALEKSALQSVTERMSLAMEAAGMGSFEWDPRTDRVVWDEQHLAITGLVDNGDTRGAMFLERIHPDDAAANQALLDQAVASHGDYVNEFRFIRPDGQIRWLAARSRMVTTQDGSGSRLIGLNWDITNQKQAIERFRLAEERLRLAAEAAGFGTYEIDLISGRTHWSPEFKKLVGADDNADQRLLPCHVADFVHPDDRAQVAGHLARAQDASDGGNHCFSHRIILPTGQVRWVRRQGQTIVSAAGTPTRIIGTLLDITTQKETEQSLEEARRIAEAANESKSEFLANMSHEIRTPMSAIMGYTDILSRQLTDPDDLKCASVIRHNGNFLLEIINDILDISKIEAGKLELTKHRFRPDQLVADVLSLMKIRAAEKSIPLVVSFDGRIPKTIHSDSKRLKQILVNLIGNAIKFTKTGSVQLVVRLLPDGGEPRLQFEIIDTGIGISPRQMKTLFQPFTQGDSSVVRKYEGTGLGLSISQRLARMLGGEITVHSQTNIGSKFSLVIATGPLDNTALIEPKKHRSRSTLPTKPISRRTLKGRILVVDDRRDMVFLAQHLIEEAGGNVSSAENGRSAIKKIAQAEKRGQPFDLIAMDMQMPILDGYETATRLRRSGYQKPIIAVTAHAMEGDRDRCLNAGCTDYITKPLDGPSFIELLANHLNRERPPSPVPTAVGNPRRILVIDDAKDSAQSLGMLLEFSGHQVELAYTGKAGIETAKKFVPEVVLLDLNLPDLNGFQVLKQLQQIASLSQTCFIAVTGHDNQAAAKNAGFDHHFMKPLDVNKLERLFDSCVTPSC